MTKPQELIKPHVDSYLKSTWYARWIIVTIVAISYLFMPHTHAAIVAAILASAVIYNIILFIGDRLGLQFLSNRPFILAADGIMALILAVYAGGSNSPYLAILVFMIVSSAYWYGIWAALLVGTIQVGTILSFNTWEKGIIASPKSFIIQIAIFVAIGLYVAWLSGSERFERSQLVSLGTETEKERQQLLALINNMGDAVLVVDPGGNVAIYNQAAIALAGSGKDLHGQPINDSLLFIDDKNRPVQLKIKRVAEPLERKDLRVRAPDGSYINVGLSIAPYIVDRQNRGYVLILRDITKDKTIDEEREEFIAVASHELRTPLTVAQADMSFLLSPPYLPKNRESVNMVNGALRSMQQLSHIINDLTNLSKVENEKLDVELEPLNPIALLHEFEADYADHAKSKGLELRVNIDPSLNLPTILTSRYVVREILTIYVSNAIEFTEKGTVTLSIEQQRNLEQGVTFCVADTGIGISHSDQKRIFEKFFQSEEYTTRSHGGTGLGLYIARKLANRLTARVWFDTELGKGSKFYLWVPPYSKHEKDQSKVAQAETKDFFNTV